MGKKLENFGDLIVRLYTIRELNSEDDTNFRTSKYMINRPPEEKIKEPLNKIRSSESICLPRTESLSNQEKITETYSKISLNNIQEKIISPINISKKPNYNSLEHIIMSESNNFENKYIDPKENIIYSQINSKLEDTVREYLAQGFLPKQSDISPEYGPIVIPKTKLGQATAPQRIKITHEGLPAQYKPLMAALAKKHPGIKYAGTLSLENQTHHNVDFVIFEYEENGAKKQIKFVAKNWDEREEKIPQFLRSMGIPACSLYEIGSGRIVMDFVNGRNLREIARNDSESEIIRASGLAFDKIAMIDVTATANLDRLEQEYGLRLERTDPNSRFRTKFLDLVSGTQLWAPQKIRAMKAYAQFSKGYTAEYFIHGDFNAANNIIDGDNDVVIDYEDARIGMFFEDVARLTYSIIRERNDIDSNEFSKYVLSKAVQSHNYHAEQNGMPVITDEKKASEALRNAIVDDSIYKVGDNLYFAKMHPDVLEEKLQKTADCLEKSLAVLDGEITHALKTGNGHNASVLTELKDSIVDVAVQSSYEQIREKAAQYKSDKTEPLILLAA